MGEEPGESRLESARLFLFDENVTPIGRALLHVYRRLIVVSEDVPDLGRGAQDEEHIIPWCVEHNAVWVTKDWRRKRNREQARALYERGVSVTWFRPTGGKEWPVEKLLAVAALAMPRLIRFYREPGTRYATIDDKGAVNELSLERLLRGNI